LFGITLETVQLPSPDLPFPVGKVETKGFAQKANPAKKKSTHESFIMRQAGVVTLVTMALSPLMMRRCLCHCRDGIIAIVDVQASLSLSS
jgi:hypothetical protein